MELAPSWWPTAAAPITAAPFTTAALHTAAAPRELAAIVGEAAHQDPASVVGEVAGGGSFAYDRVRAASVEVYYTPRYEAGERVRSASLDDAQSTASSPERPLLRWLPSLASGAPS